MLLLALSLAFLEIRYEMRRRLILDETGFTRYFTSYLINGRIFIRVFTFYIAFDDLFLNSRVSDDQRNVCGRRLDTRVYSYTKIRGPRFERNYVVMGTWHVISIIAENKPHVHHKTHLHTIKVYNTRPVISLIIKILFFFDH